MELYCEHHDSLLDDDTFLLDDENTNERQLKCLTCNNRTKVQSEDFNSIIQIEGNSWIQNRNGVITGMSHNETVIINSDNLDSPEDSPLLASVSILTFI